MSVSIRTIMYGERIVVDVAGTLDLATSPALREGLVELTAAGHVDVTVDLGGVTFIDSTGFGVLMNASKAAQHRGGFLQLVIPAGSPVAKTIRISGLDRLFVVHETLEAALRR